MSALTPAMLKAGVAALREHVGAHALNEASYTAEDIARAVWEAMADVADFEGVHAEVDALAKARPRTPGDTP